MATIYNSDLSKELIEGAKIQTSREGIPTQIAEKVVPVMEVNPKLLRRVNVVRGISKTNTGAQVIYTTPTDKDFILTGVIYAVTKNAACDAATGRSGISVIIEGATQTIGMVSILTATASDQSNSIDFPQGIKLDRGQNISTAGSTTYAAGNMSITATILGYTIDNANS